MTTPQPPRWHCVDKMGGAILCESHADAQETSQASDLEWPRDAPHRAVLLVDATSTKPAERAYRSIKADPPPIGVRLNLLTTHGAHTQGVLSPLNMPDFLGWEHLAKTPPGMIT